jgi:hypothetical protein
MNVINTNYIAKQNNEVFLFTIDIYKGGLWNFNFRKGQVFEFTERKEAILETEQYSFYVRVPRYIDEQYAAFMNSYKFNVPKTSLDDNKYSFLKLKKSDFYVCTKHYYLCSSFKDALTALNKYHITNKRYNEITKRKRQRIYKKLFTSWLKSNNKINFVCSTR